MTLTWVRDTKAKEKPIAPNNPISDIELGITISLVYKGAEYKRRSWFLWALAQSAREPISSPQMGPGCPTKSPRRSWGRDGGMRVWWIHLESQRRGPTTCPSFSHTGSHASFSLCNYNNTFKRLYICIYNSAKHSETLEMLHLPQD